MWKDDGSLAQVDGERRGFFLHESSAEEFNLEAEMLGMEQEVWWASLCFVP